MLKILAGALVGLFASASLAQAPFPSRPVRIIVGFPPGGSADLMPRLVAPRLQEKWGQPVVVENRIGAAGNVGAELVWKSEPDGHTLLAAPPGPLATHQSLYSKLAYDPDTFVPVTMISIIPNVLLTHPSVKVNTLAELIALAKAHPDKLNYASQGSGGTAHLSTEFFKSMTGARIVHVPYRGSAPAVADLLAGQVDMMFENVASALPHVRAGKVKVLGVGSAKRLDALPDSPAISELLPGFVSIAWYAIAAPPKTPATIATKIAADVSAILTEPEIVKRLTDRAATPVGGTPEETARFIRAEAQLWGKVIREAGAKVD